MTERTRVPSNALERIGREAVARSKRQREFWASGWHPIAWLRCVMFHGGSHFWTTENDRIIRWECGRCSRPRMEPCQRECCTPEDPCGPNDPDGICRTCASYADPEDVL